MDFIRWRREGCQRDAYGIIVAHSQGSFINSRQTGICRQSAISACDNEVFRRNCNSCVSSNREA